MSGEEEDGASRWPDLSLAWPSGEVRQMSNSSSDQLRRGSYPQASLTPSLFLSSSRMDFARALIMARNLSLSSRAAFLRRKKSLFSSICVSCACSSAVYATFSFSDSISSAAPNFVSRPSGLAVCGGLRTPSPSFLKSHRSLTSVERDLSSFGLSIPPRKWLWSSSSSGATRFDGMSSTFPVLPVWLSFLLFLAMLALLLVSFFASLPSAYCRMNCSP